MPSLTEVIQYNRSTLADIDSFILTEDYNSSPDNYGLPPNVQHLIDLPLNKELTYVDILMYLQQKFDLDQITYVEIGVSVLKTFFQVSNFLTNSKLYAFDINNINPTIAKRFIEVSCNDTVRKYKYNTNSITYFKGDVFKEEDFLSFKNEINGKANIVFSDAHHTGSGLLSEYNNYIKDALSEDFILYYDDLQNQDMQKVFVEISKDLKSQYTNVTSAFLVVNGWLGQHEFAHLNGIVTSLDLRSTFPGMQYI